MSLVPPKCAYIGFPLRINATSVSDCPSKLRIVFKFIFSTIRQYPVEVVRFVVEVLKILEETKLNVDQKCPPSHPEITSSNGVQMAFLPVYAFTRFPFRGSTSTPITGPMQDPDHRLCGET